MLDGGRDEGFDARDFGARIRAGRLQIRVGAIDLKRTDVAPIGSFMSAIKVPAMPFLFCSIDNRHKLPDRPIGNDILGSFAPCGCRRDRRHLPDSATRTGDRLP